MTTPKSDAPPLTVWLVEDYAPFRNTVSRLLNGTDGMACTHIFATAEDALRSLKSQTKPRAILVDVGLPGMSGEDLALKVRERFPSLPVVIASGYGRPGLQGEGMQFISKPYSSIDLQQALDHAVR